MNRELNFNYVLSGSRLTPGSTKYEGHGGPEPKIHILSSVLTKARTAARLVFLLSQGLQHIGACTKISMSPLPTLCWILIA